MRLVLMGPVLMLRRMEECDHLLHILERIAEKFPLLRVLKVGLGNLACCDASAALR